MQPPQQHSRINLAELKAQIVRKLGLEGSKQYFHYLNRFLSLKLNKVEFNTVCLRIIGRENFPLHNLFIRSTLRNACSAKVPPPTHDEEILKFSKAVGNKQPISNEHQQNGGPPNSTTQTPISSTNTNGDILPLSPRRARTGIRDRRFGDHHSALGPNGKINFASERSLVAHCSDNALKENGNSNPPENPSSVQYHQELMQQADSDGEIVGHHLTKLSVVNRLPDIPVSVHSNDQTELLVVENGKCLSARCPLQAPLGVPLHPVSVGGARKAMPSSISTKYVKASNSGGLLDMVTLRKRMEQIVLAQGLEGVSMDCAILLNYGLDAYLKGIIRSCIELVGANSTLQPTKNISYKHQFHTKLINGVRPGHQYQIQSCNRPLEAVEESRLDCPVSLRDFRVAMELNPQQLGEDWPLLLEKICTHAFED